jgi:hypothetical protein
MWLEYPELLFHNTERQTGPLLHRGERNKKNSNLFKDKQIKIEFRTQNTIENILKHHPRTDKYNKSGIYQMKCIDCLLKYIRQTGRIFHTTYKEHIKVIKIIIIIIQDTQATY